jgi:hypothetical protein
MSGGYQFADAVEAHALALKACPFEYCCFLSPASASRHRCLTVLNRFQRVEEIMLMVVMVVAVFYDAKVATLIHMLKNH